MTAITMKKSFTKRLSVWAIVVAGILMLPLVTNAPWTGSDYTFAGIVLFGLASAYEFITRNMKNDMHRMAVGAAVIMVLLAIWAWAVA